MNLLQLCIKPPYPPVDGGTLAMHSITQGLLDAGHRVKVLAVCSDKHPVLHDQMTDAYRQQTQFEAVHIDLRPHLLPALYAMLSGESYHVRRYRSAAFADKLREVLQADRYDVVLVEGLFLTPYIPLIRQHSHAQVVLRAHNVEHRIWEQMAQGCHIPLKRGYLKHLALTLRHYELEHINDYDAVVCISPADADLFRQNGCRRLLTSIPFGINPEPMEHIDVEPASLFHLGSMDWMPNVEGIDWFLQSVWPRLHAEVPQARLYLAGRKMPRRLIDHQPDGVTVVGEVADAMYFIASKQINVVPLLSGSGIRVKIIEAMSAGKTVVTTRVGARGIDARDGEHLLLADTADDFVRQIRRCIEEPEYCQQIGRNAYQLIADTYNIETLTQQLIEFLCATQAS